VDICVEILVITYNQQDYISECIVSILNQSYVNIRVKVFDDFSTDSTLSKLSSINDNRLKVYPATKNLGITGNCNRALNNLKTDLFVLVGGDDVFYPTKVELQVNYFKKNPNHIICGHKLNYIDSNSIITGEMKTYAFDGVGAKSWINKGMIFGAFAMMYNFKDVSKDIIFDERVKYASDWKLIVDLLGEKGRYGAIDIALGGYRRHANNITVIKQLECKKDWLLSLEILKSEGKITEADFKKGKASYYTFFWFKHLLRQNKFKEALKVYLSYIKIFPFSLRGIYGLFLFVLQLVKKNKK
tara:strand:- start:14575 stop:15474 length:900 start_codon:yes stop_codon:yes gene_type:complete